MEYTIQVDGIPLPHPKREGVQIREEKIWSANTGRAASTKMLGEVIGLKTTIQISWNALTPSQAELIRAAASNRETIWHTLTYTDLSGLSVTKTVYFDNPTYTIRSLAGGGRITNVILTAIEQ